MTENQISKIIVDAAIEVHRELGGPGLLEDVYEEALDEELRLTELPAHWPAAYRALVERRLALIERDRNIALIEQPEYKRRWNVEPWDEQQERALRQWLLNRLEGYFFEGERMLGSAGASPAVGGALAANTLPRPADQSARHQQEAPGAGRSRARRR